MIWAFIAVLSLIQATISKPLYEPEVFRQAKRAKSIEASSPADIEPNLRFETNDATSLSGLVPDLDKSHVTRVFESNVNGPYFWDNEYFKSNTHDSWEAFDRRKRDKTQLGIIEQVQEVQADVEVLKESLKSHQELRVFSGFYKDQDAYQTLENFLDQIALFESKKQDQPGIYGKSAHTHEILWEPLVSAASQSVNELRYILFNVQAPRNSLEMQQFPTLITQIFGIINILFQNNLISSKVFEELIENKNTKELISIHIKEMFGKKSLLGLDFHECLLKSKATEHLAFVLKFSPQEFFKNLESDFLIFKYGNLGHMIRRIPDDLWTTARQFRQYIFENDDGKYMNKIKGNIHDTIDHFENPALISAGHMRDYTVRILYDMICFDIKYHPEMFNEILKSAKARHSLSIKLNLLDSALRFARSSKEIEFFSQNGFWTSELSFSRSKHQIPLKQAKYWKSVPSHELEYFKDNFKCFISKDFDDWAGVFEAFSKERSNSEIHSPECVHKNCKFTKILDSFGTNFRLKKPNQEYINDYQKTLEHEPMISGLFIDELSLWIQKLELLAKKNKDNRKIWEEIQQRISSSNEINTRGDVQEWFENSPLVSMVMEYNEDHLMLANENWDKIKLNMEVLNQNIRSLMDKKHEQSSQHRTIWQNKKAPKELDLDQPDSIEDQDLSSTSSSLQIHEGLTIPEISF